MELSLKDQEMQAELLEAPQEGNLKQMQAACLAQKQFASASNSKQRSLVPPRPKPLTYCPAVSPWVKVLTAACAKKPSGEPNYISIHGHRLGIARDKLAKTSANTRRSSPQPLDQRRLFMNVLKDSLRASSKEDAYSAKGFKKKSSTVEVRVGAASQVKTQLAFTSRMKRHMQLDSKAAQGKALSKSPVQTLRTLSSNISLRDKSKEGQQLTAKHMFAVNAPSSSASRIHTLQGLSGLDNPAKAAISRGYQKGQLQVPFGSSRQYTEGQKTTVLQGKTARGAASAHTSRPPSPPSRAGVWQGANPPCLSYNKNHQRVVKRGRRG